MTRLLLVAWFMAFGRVVRLVSRRPRVLLLGRPDHWARYLRREYLALKATGLDLDIRVTCDGEDRARGLAKTAEQVGAPPIGFRAAQLRHWDLCLHAGHVSGIYCDAVHVSSGHGLHTGKCIRGDEYRFGGAPRWPPFYDLLFASAYQELDAGPRINPATAGRILLTSDLLLDELLERDAARLEAKRALGLEGRKTLLVVSTWGVDSLAHREDMRLLAQLRSLAPDYTVLLSLHPANYIYRAESPLKLIEELAAARGAHLRTLAPEDDWLACMNAADVCLTDHGSMGLYWLFLGRPTLLYRSASAIFDESTVFGRLMPHLPVATSLDLRTQLADAERGFARDDVERILRETFVPPGSGARERTELYKALITGGRAAARAVLARRG